MTQWSMAWHWTPRSDLQEKSSPKAVLDRNEPIPRHSQSPWQECTISSVGTPTATEESRAAQALSLTQACLQPPPRPQSHHLCGSCHSGASLSRGKSFPHVSPYLPSIQSTAVSAGNVWFKHFPPWGSAPPPPGSSHEGGGQSIWRPTIASTG